MVWDHVHRLLHESRLLELHAGRGHHESLARSDRVRQEHVARAHAPPDGIFLVRAEPYRAVHPRKFEMRAVEEARTEIVVGVVIEADQSLGSFGILEDRASETSL